MHNAHSNFNKIYINLNYYINNKKDYLLFTVLTVLTEFVSQDLKQCLNNEKLCILLLTINYHNNKCLTKVMKIYSLFFLFNYRSNSTR